MTKYVRKLLLFFLILIFFVIIFYTYCLFFFIPFPQLNTNKYIGYDSICLRSPVENNFFQLNNNRKIELQIFYPSYQDKFISNIEYKYLGNKKDFFVSIISDQFPLFFPFKKI